MMVESLGTSSKRNMLTNELTNKSNNKQIKQQTNVHTGAKDCVNAFDTLVAFFYLCAASLWVDTSRLLPLMFLPITLDATGPVGAPVPRGSRHNIDILVIVAHRCSTICSHQMVEEKRCRSIDHGCLWA